MLVIIVRLTMEKIKISNKYVGLVEDKDDFIRYVSSQNDGLIIAANAKKIVNNDNTYTRIFNKAITYPDGKSIVKFMNKKGYNAIKYPGYIMWLDYLKVNQRTKKCYFIGATQEVIDVVVKKALSEFPSLQIVGYRNGYLKEEDKKGLLIEFSNLKPDVIFVGTAYPKQEFLMDELTKSYKALYFGLGGSFNVYAGLVKPVPEWWEKYIGYESIYRLIIDPKKIKRQFSNLKFLILATLNKL